MVGVDVPVLVVIGKKDIQVNWKDDGELLQRARRDAPTSRSSSPTTPTTSSSTSRTRWEN
jgi:hypothetical protein